MNRKDFYRKISFVVMVGCVFAVVACAPQREDVAGTEVVETQRLETEVTEETEGAGGETAGEVMVEIMQNVQDGCVVVIDNVEGVKGY